MILAETIKCFTDKGQQNISLCLMSLLLCGHTLYNTFVLNGENSLI